MIKNSTKLTKIVVIINCGKYYNIIHALHTNTTDALFILVTDQEFIGMCEEKLNSDRKGQTGKC